MGALVAQVSGHLSECPLIGSSLLTGSEDGSVLLSETQEQKVRHQQSEVRGQRSRCVFTNRVQMATPSVVVMAAAGSSSSSSLSLSDWLSSDVSSSSLWGSEGLWVTQFNSVASELVGVSED